MCLGVALWLVWLEGDENAIGAAHEALAKFTKKLRISKNKKAVAVLHNFCCFGWGRADVGRGLEIAPYILLPRKQLKVQVL